MREDQLRVLTYNLWIEHLDDINRMKSLIQVLLDADADFMCLQEVTVEHLKWLLNNNDLKERYKFISDNQFDLYGIIIFSKYPCWFYERIIPSVEGTSILFAEPVNGINGVPLIVAMS